MTEIQLAVVVNPARSDAADNLLNELDESDSLSIDVIRPRKPDLLPRAMRKAVENGATHLAAVGGDGTQRSAAIALNGTSCALVVVPGGTVNLLGRVIGVTDPTDSAAVIMGGATRKFDLGTVNDELFLLNASTGYDARVIHGVDDRGKQLGRLAFLVEGWRQLRHEQPRPVTVTVDDAEIYRGRAMGVLVANFGQRGSGTFEVMPDAEPDDGKIDVAIQRSDDVRSVARVLLALRRGQEPEREDLILAQGKNIQVGWSKPVWSQRDGDSVEQTTDFTYGVVPGALTVAVPVAGGRAR